MSSENFKNWQTLFDKYSDAMQNKGGKGGVKIKKEMKNIYSNMSPKEQNAVRSALVNYHVVQSSDVNWTDYERIMLIFSEASENLGSDFKNWAVKNNIMSCYKECPNLLENIDFTKI